MQIIKIWLFSTQNLFFLSLFFCRNCDKVFIAIFAFFFKIVNLKIILKKFVSLINLSRAQIFYIYETTKVVIIYKNKYLIFITFQIVILCFKDFDNSQKFAIISFILSFCKIYFFKKNTIEYHWPKLVLVIISLKLNLKINWFNILSIV